MDESKQLTYVTQNCQNIQYIENPSERVQLEVVKLDEHIIQFIKIHLNKFNLAQLIKIMNNCTLKIQI